MPDEVAQNVPRGSRGSTFVGVTGLRPAFREPRFFFQAGLEQDFRESLDNSIAGDFESRRTGRPRPRSGPGCRSELRRHPARRASQ